MNKIKRNCGGIDFTWAAGFLGKKIQEMKDNGANYRIINPFIHMVDELNRAARQTVPDSSRTKEAQYNADYIMRTMNRSIQFIEDLYALECIKAGYLANGGNEDDFYAMEEGEWTECFRLWFDAWKKNTCADRNAINPPVNVGDSIYRIWSCGSNGKSVAEFTVTGIHNQGDGWYITYKGKNRAYTAKFEDFGVTVFTDPEAASAKI